MGRVLHGSRIIIITLAPTRLCISGSSKCVVFSIVRNAMGRIFHESPVSAISSLLALHANANRAYCQGELPWVSPSGETALSVQGCID